MNFYSLIVTFYVGIGFNFSDINCSTDDIKTSKLLLQKANLEGFQVTYPVELLFMFLV